MRRVVVVVACVIGLLWVAPVTGAAPAPARAAAGTAASGAVTGGRSALADFNADSYADLAVGLSATTVPDQLWSQGSPNVEGTPNSGDRFGSSLAAA